MSLNDVLARLRPTARSRYANEANTLGMEFEVYMQDLLDNQGLNESDMVLLQGGFEPLSIWPADMTGGG